MKPSNVSQDSAPQSKRMCLSDVFSFCIWLFKSLVRFFSVDPSLREMNRNYQSPEFLYWDTCLKISLLPTSMHKPHRWFVNGFKLRAAASSVGRTYVILNNKEILKPLLNFLTIVLKRFTIQRRLDVVKPFIHFLYLWPLAGDKLVKEEECLFHYHERNLV